ncbi:hypothetical protein HAX54_005114 [Datura stramonium]|uniref:Uncharacterized protein n=1 Tax=Datura stramonium TaxID=4076 RepID=A0ABS8T8X0_DATST|nr:hypothetical protein [Datura stramonium]
MLLGWSLYFLLNRLGWTRGLFTAVVFSLWGPELGNMMAPAGDSGANLGSDLGHTLSSSVKHSLYPVVLFFRGLSDAAPTPELGEEVQQVCPTHSISQTDLWYSLSSSAPTLCQDNQQPLVVEQPPAASPSVPRKDLSHVPPRSPPSLSLFDQEVLKQFFLEKGAVAEQQEQPGVPEALPLAPAPAEEPELITTSIITKMK